MKIPILLIVFALAAVYVLQRLVRGYLFNKARHRRQFVMICEVNGRIGLVTQDDFTKCMRAHWKKYRRGAEYDFGGHYQRRGYQIKVSPIFVLKGREQLEELSSWLYIQEGIFSVPSFGSGDGGAHEATGYVLFGYTPKQKGGASCTQ